MADHVFKLGEGLDPIRFGMSRSEVLELLGEPKRQYRFDRQSTSSKELDAVIDASGLEGLTEHLAEIFKGQLIDGYNEGELDDWNGGGPLSYISSVTYFDGTVSKITSLDCRDRIMFKDIELTASNVFATLRALHAMSEEIYVETAYVYFDDLKVILTLDRDKQRLVAVTDGRTEEALFDAEEYRFFERDEFEEFVAGEEEVEK